MFMFLSVGISRLLERVTWLRNPPWMHNTVFKGSSRPGGAPEEIDLGRDLLAIGSGTRLIASDFSMASGRKSPVKVGRALWRPACQPKVLTYLLDLKWSVVLLWALPPLLWRVWVWALPNFMGGLNEKALKKTSTVENVQWTPLNNTLGSWQTHHKITTGGCVFNFSLHLFIYFVWEEACTRLSVWRSESSL